MVIGAVEGHLLMWVGVQVVCWWIMDCFDVVTSSNRTPNNYCSALSNMTTREQRREEYSSSVRVMSPSRSITPTTHGHQFDNRLDNLLEDLQASVSRPGSSLGQPITNYSSSREVQYLQPSNVTTVARERSVSPSITTNERKVYKTAKYEYKSSGGSTLPVGAGRTDQSVSEVYQRNINQLDTLLNDLERERDSSLDRSKYAFRFSDAGLPLRQTKTTNGDGC
uniref:Uncharacterized protein n=1 Tax=Anopheles culicifacies TaxID=139723 RepID=A0A182M3U4_9DIPT